MRLPRFALEHRAVVIGATAIAVAWGMVAFLTSPRRENPEYTIRTCLIVTIWPGASAEKIEQLVTDPIEKAVDSIDEVEKVTSTSRASYSVIFVDAEDHVTDTDGVWDKVRAKVKNVRGQLPTGCREPLVNTDFGDTAAMVLAIYQDPEMAERRRYSPREMEVIAKRLKDEIKLLEAVADAQLYGVQHEAIYLEADVGTWSQLKLTTPVLKAILAQRNIVAPGGTIDAEFSRFGVKPSGEFDALRELNRVTVGHNSLSLPVSLADEGIEVVRDYEDPPRTLTRYSDAKVSQTCVTLAFTMKDGENITVLGEEVKELIERAHLTFLPRDIEVAVVSDQPKVVDDKVNDFVLNLLVAVVIVVLVPLLLSGLRVAVVMAAAIPVIMLASVGAMRFFGVELEQVSIAALIIALGILVDNAIQVCDNVQRHLREGCSRWDAAVQGASQIGPPILIATLTIIAAFLPMVIALEGTTREYVYSLPVVVSLTLGISWVVAMTVTTRMAYRLIQPNTKGAPLGRAVGWLVRLVQRKRRRGVERSTSTDRESQGLYMRLCDSCVRHKFLTVGLAVLLLAGSTSLVVTGMVGSQFFPNAARDQFVVDVNLPEGTPIHRTDEVCRRVEQIIGALGTEPTADSTRRDRLRNTISFVGGGAPRFYIALTPEPTASNYAQILVNTTGPEVVEQYLRDIRRAVWEGIPARGIKPIGGARVVPKELILGKPVPSPIAVRLFGSGFADIQTMRKQAEKLKQVFRASENTWDVHDSWGDFGYQLNVNVAPDRANLAGVTNATIAQTLYTYLSGYPLTTYREGDHQVPVYLRLPAEQRSSPEILRRVYVEGFLGKVPLDAVAKVESVWEPAKIERYELNRMIEIQARPEEGFLPNAVLSELMSGIRDIEKQLPSGYRIEISGEQEETVEGQRQVARSLGISLLLIVLCLIIQYNSLVKPLMILMTLPLATIGAVLGLYLTGNPMGFMANLGMLSLFGIVLNAAIVYIEFAEILIKEKLEKGEGLAQPGEKSCSGLSCETFRQCLARAGKMRILPISLTTLTTVGGLIPLALFGGPLFEAMAV
ncbi:MAG: efflux RND transporter permease subunit, partial [Planctomycetes bacterium]|nr:efflux RND transporter permease subunit [Planctomycetota bacterium]